MSSVPNQCQPASDGGWLIAFSPPSSASAARRQRLQRVELAAVSAAGRTGVAVNLDNISAEALAFVYEVVKARREFLSKPAS